MKTIVDAFFFKRHFWHKVKVSELNELYMALTLRVLGLNLIGIFIPIYLYNQGVELQFIALTYVGSYGWRLLFDPLSAMLVARYGPKHILRISFLADSIFILSIIAVGHQLLPLLALSLIFAACMSLFMVPFHVDMSLVEQVNKAGKQLSAQAILEKIAAAAGPLIGGFIAMTFGFEAAIFTALIVTISASIPLLASSERVQATHLKYKFSFKDFKIPLSTALGMLGRAGNATLGAVFWPVLAALAIFASDERYVGLGLITALGLGASLFSAHLIGRLVDNRKGRELLRYGTLLSALSHSLKPLISTPLGSAGISTISESLDSAHRLPFMKGYYAEADEMGSKRIAYVVGTLLYFHLGEVILMLGLVALTWVADDITALKLIILISSLMSLLQLKEKFKALNT